MVFHAGGGLLTALIINAILGLGLLWLINEFTDMQIPFNAITIILAVLFGILGALLVVVLVAVDVM